MGAMYVEQAQSGSQCFSGTGKQQRSLGCLGLACQLASRACMAGKTARKLSSPVMQHIQPQRSTQQHSCCRPSSRWC